MSNVDLVKWLSSELSNLVGCEISDDYSKYDPKYAVQYGIFIKI